MTAILPDSQQVQNSGIGTKVVRGTLLSLTAQGAVLLGSFVATPFVIRLLGTEAYGTLSLINVFIGYLALSEIGMGMGSTRFGGDAHARGDDQAETAAIWTALLIGGVPTVLLGLMVFLLAPIVVTNFSGFAPSFQRSATIALQFGAIAFCFRMLSGVLNTPQVVRLRMDLVTLLTYGTNLAQVLLTPVVLWMGGGLPSALAVAAVLAVLGAILNFIVSGRLLPQMLRPQIDASLIKPLLTFGGGVVFSSWATLALVNGEKLLLAHYVSVTALAHYAVASTLALTLTQIPVAMSQSLLSAFSRLQAISHERLQLLYESAVRVAFFSVIPVATLISVIARPFFTLWAGPEYGKESTLPLYILMGGTVFFVLSYIPYSLLVAFGKTGWIARLHLAELVPYLLVAAILTKRYGVIGAASVWSLRAFISAVAIFLIARHASGFALSSLLKFRWPNLVAVVLLLPMIGVMFWEGAQVLRIGVLVLALAAYIVVVVTRVLRVEERTLLLSLLPFRID